MAGSVRGVGSYGNSLRVEDPGEYQSIRHREYGVELTFAGPREDEDPDDLSPRYVHIPIPTPRFGGWLGSLVDPRICSVQNNGMVDDQSNLPLRLQYRHHALLGRSHRSFSPGPLPTGNATESDPKILYIAAVGADFVYPRSNLSFYTGFQEISRAPIPLKRAGKN